MSNIKANPKASSSKSSNTVVSQPPEQVFYPNVLDQHDRPAYHFQLYMLSDKKSSLNQFTYSSITKNKAMIAESGATSDFAIEDVKLHGIPGMTKPNGSGTSTTISFTIKEPMGSSLFDIMKEKASEIGALNFRKAAYVLELSFVGEYKGEVGGGYSHKQRWLYPLIITAISTSVDASGSEYKVTAVHKDDIAFSNLYGDIKEGISITATTVGDYFEKLTEELINIQRLEGVPEKYITKHRFEFEEPIDEYFLLGGRLSINSNTTTRFDLESPSNDTIVQFGANSSVSSIIENVLMNTAEMQKEGLCSFVEDKDGNKGIANNPNKDLFAKIFRVYSHTTLMEYNEYKGDYTRVITYYVKFYEAIIATTNSLDLKGKYGLEEMQNILSGQKIRKRYDYIFSGLNDQVLDMRLDFNLAFYYEEPAYGGMSQGNLVSPQNAPSIEQTVRKSLDHNLIVEAAMENIRVGNTNSDSPQVNYIAPVNSLPLAANPSPDSNVPVKKVTTKNSTVPAAARGTKTPVPGVEDKSGNGKTMLQFLYEQHKTADMITMELDIKGDPYWLEPAPFDIRVDAGNPLNFSLKRKFEENKKNNDKHVFTKDGDVFILFNAGLPNIGEGIADGYVRNNRSGYICGIYRVIEILSEFSDGKFTQKLSTIRENIIDVKKTGIRNIV